MEETNNKNMWSPGLKIEQFFIIPKKKSEFPLSFFKKNFKDSTSHLDSFFIRYTFFVETLTTIIIRSCNSRSKPARQRLSSLFFLIFGWDKKQVADRKWASRSRAKGVRSAFIGVQLRKLSDHTCPSTHGVHTSTIFPKRSANDHQINGAIHHFPMDI